MKNIEKQFLKSVSAKQAKLICKVKLFLTIMELPLLKKYVAHYPIGFLIFRLSILIKQINLLRGKWGQRAIEYPWLISNLKTIKRDSLVLDVGCSESLVTHELIRKGFRVAGLDINDYPFKDKHVFFIKRNLLNTKLPSGVFDVITMVSTIEHIGLEAYGQIAKDTDADIEALSELKRILKDRGIIIITTPYVGTHNLKVGNNVRLYNMGRLNRLVSGLKIVKEAYFYPLKVKNRFLWIEVSKQQMDKLPFSEKEESIGLACFILQKD